MSLRRALVRNTAWYGAVTVVGVVSALIMSVILARGLGPAGVRDSSMPGHTPINKARHA